MTKQRIAIASHAKHLLSLRSGALLLGLAAAAAVVAPATASASSLSAGASPVVGHVYVDDNTAGTNTIGAFDRHADGSLTPTAGSPFAAGGAGTGSGLASQGAIQFSADGRYVLAVDAGSNQISVLRVHRDGVAQPGPRRRRVRRAAPCPVSIAVHGSLVYVANAGNGGSNYTGFRFFGGHLFRIPGSTVTLAANAAQPATYCSTARAPS